jgi:polyhydroxyalkanoate synthesis regulator phasin
LKLHIETVEDRVEELEREIAKLDNHSRTESKD